MRQRVVLGMVCLALWVSGAEALERLSTRGKDIVNASGNVVSLRGINFGGWLMMETWIPSIEMEWHDHLPRLAKEVGIEAELKQALEEVGEHNDDTTKIQDYLVTLHAALKKRTDPAKYDAYMALFAKEPSIFAAKDMDDELRKRFGDNGAAEVWNTYHETWITEHDFQLAKALGFNFIRLPFWYRWFESDARPGEYFDYGFEYLDKALSWAERHGLYVLLDFHGAVGGQSPWDHTGELSRGEFFANREYQRRTAALWKAIAKRYKDNPTVFGYDLLNEPYSAKDLKNWSEAHDVIYDAIREVDAATIIVMEDGYKLEDMPYREKGFFPRPEEMGWTNVVYSFHFYSGPDPLFSKGDGQADHGKRAEEVLRVGAMEQNRCNVPIYIGEFSTMANSPNDIEGMRIFLTLFNEQGWHWSPWTWKYVNDDGVGSIWGVYQYVDPWPGTPNMYRDSKQSILDLIGRLGTVNFRLQEPYADVLRSCLSQPVSAAR